MKPVTDPKEALNKTQDAVPAKQYVFAKNQSPWEKEVLKSGLEVMWRRPVIHGVLQGHGFFETTDQQIAKELREYAIANPARRIFEQE